MMKHPPTRPANGCSALDEMVTTPPPSGFRQVTSAYFSDRSTKTKSVMRTKIAARLS